jgi:hydroxymethylpyrimidine/phosphomethylpyrimidine kinase
MSVIVSVVAENTARVIDIQDVRPDMIEKQIDAVFEDIRVDSVKVGMLSGPDCMMAVSGKLREYGPANVVIDPVMYAKNGSPLMDPGAISSLIDLIIPLAGLLTPNIPEAEHISGLRITSAKDMRSAARIIMDMGCGSVLVKGGHAAGNALDVLFDGTDFFEFDAERIDTKNTHGTGCTYSSAIASNLALGHPMKEAVRLAKEYVTTAIRHALPIGRGNGPTHHFYDLYRHGLRGHDAE